MEITKELIEKITKDVVLAMEGKKDTDTIPVGISARHIHLSNEHVEILFGKGHKLELLKPLMGDMFAAKEQVTIVSNSMRIIEKVRVLGPVRRETQVEISRTDSITLKTKAPVRESGDIKGSTGILIIGPCGSVSLDEGLIIANRHIHMTKADAIAFNLKDNDYVDVEVFGERNAIWTGVQVRVSDNFHLEMHIDTDDANSVGNIKKVRIRK